MRKRRRCYWLAGLLFVVGWVVGCGQVTAPAPGLQADLPAHRAAVTLDQIYWATPALGSDPWIDSSVGVDESLDAALLIHRGELLYAANCAPCHRRNGAGNLQHFPALRGNAFVTAQVPTPLIRTVLYGRGVMPAFARTLNDQEVAALLSYIRNSWGNEASVIHAAAVRDVTPVIRATATPSSK